MKNPKTTSLGIIIGAAGAIVIGVGKLLQGETPNWTEITLAITTILGAIGLYKAVDPK